MFKVVYRIVNCFVVDYTPHGPEHLAVSAVATAMCRSPKEALRMAREAAKRSYGEAIPDVVWNEVGEWVAYQMFRNGRLIREYDSWMSNLQGVAF